MNPKAHTFKTKDETILVLHDNEDVLWTPGTGDILVLNRCKYKVINVEFNFDIQVMLYNLEEL